MLLGRSLFVEAPKDNDLFPEGSPVGKYPGIVLEVFFLLEDRTSSVSWLALYRPDKVEDFRGDSVFLGLFLGSSLKLGLQRRILGMLLSACEVEGCPCFVGVDSRFSVKYTNVFV